MKKAKKKEKPEPVFIAVTTDTDRSSHFDQCIVLESVLMKKKPVRENSSDR